MQRLAETCEAIAATTKKLQKTAIVADYLKSRTDGRGRGVGGVSLGTGISRVGGNDFAGRRIAAVARRGGDFRAR